MNSFVLIPFSISDSLANK